MLRRCASRLQSSPNSILWSLTTSRHLNFRAMTTSFQADSPRDHDRVQPPRKRQSQGGPPPKRQKTRKEKYVKPKTGDEVLLADVRALFAAQTLKVTSNSTVVEFPQLEVGDATSGEHAKPANTDLLNTTTNGARSRDLPEPFTEIEVKVVELSSTGDGLAIHPSSDQIYVVPYTTPGDVVKAKVYKHFQDEHYTLADFISVVQPSPLRDDTRIRCKYFSVCSGCQFQMLDYETQLKHKKKIVENAYKNFSQLPPDMIPVVQDTIGSPLQYGYRTKLTPHFDGPPGGRRIGDRRNGIKHFFKEAPAIGFMPKGRKTTLDIEDCPIGTDAVRMGMKQERARVAKDIDKYHKGATILLRESTLRVLSSDSKATATIPNAIQVTTPTYTDFKSCITDNNGTSTEYIDSFIFTNPAGSFFQNNNSILPPFTQYIRDHILPPPSVDSSQPQIKFLIDAYSGSGLFTITLSSLFTSSTGIDIAGASILYAGKNAELNNLPPSQCTFIAADATELFKSVKYPPDETVVVIDPPRKGCDESFLRQLLGYGPRRVVYVSCNVHTQARDVGVLVRGMEGGGGATYKVESLRGFDFFPQTGHVEGVAVLSRVEGKGTEEL